MKPLLILPITLALVVFTPFAFLSNVKAQESSSVKGEIGANVLEEILSIEGCIKDSSRPGCDGLQILVGGTTTCNSDGLCTVEDMKLVSFFDFVHLCVEKNNTQECLKNLPQ